MSWIDLKVIEAPEKATVTKNGGDITVKRPRGELTRYFDPCITFKQKDGKIHFSRSSEADKALHSIEGVNLASTIEGVTDGYTKELISVGVGHCAVVQGKKLALNVGYSHPVIFEALEGVIVKTPPTAPIEIESISKQVVGQFAAGIRDVRLSEPHKDKSIRYEDGYVRRKEGKIDK